YWCASAMGVQYPGEARKEASDDTSQTHRPTGRPRMSIVTRRLAVLSTACFILAASGGNTLAQKQYGPGVTDTEIKIGNIMPYSGPASAYGVIGKTEDADF